MEFECCDEGPRKPAFPALHQMQTKEEWLKAPWYTGAERWWRIGLLKSATDNVFMAGCILTDEEENYFKTAHMNVFEDHFKKAVLGLYKIPYDLVDNPNFSLFFLKAPLNFSCLIVDDCRGIYMVEGKYKTFNNPEVAAVLKRLMTSQFGGAIVPATYEVITQNPNEFLEEQLKEVPADEVSLPDA